MKLERTEHGAATVLALQGRMNMGSDLELLRGAIHDEIAAGRSFVVLDLARLTYTDSAALGEIVASRRRLRDVGGALVLARPSGKVRGFIDMTRLDQLIDVYEELEEAVDAVTAD